MPFAPLSRVLLAFGLSALLAGCGGGIGSSNLMGDGLRTRSEEESKAAADAQRANLARARGEKRQSTLFDLFTNAQDPNATVKVNKYLWNASLDVLNFLPIQSVDPFSGVIVTGFGTPPGSGRSYRATIYVQDPALDARSLKVALVGAGGQPVGPDVARAVEDAILTRARQLRVQDSKL